MFFRMFLICQVGICCDGGLEPEPKRLADCWEEAFEALRKVADIAGPSPSTMTLRNVWGWAMEPPLQTQRVLEFPSVSGQTQFKRTWEFINFKGGKLCLQIIVLQYFRLSVSSGRVGLVPSYFPSVSRALVENIWPREKVVNRMLLIRVKCAGFNRWLYIDLIRFIYLPWATKSMKHKGFGHLKTGLFTINNL